MNEYLSIKEVGLLLGVSRRTVERYIKQGIIPTIQLTARTTRIPKRDLEKCLSELMVHQASVAE